VIIKRDVPHVSLDLLHSERNSMTVIVSDGIIGRELEEIMRLALNDGREEIAALQSEVLNDEIERIVRVLDARDGDIPNFFDQSGKDHFTNVIPKIGLEFKRTLAVKEQIFC